MSLLDPNRPKKRRRDLPAVPAPAPDTEELRAAQAIVTAISQGLPADQFCKLMNVMNSEPVKLAAAMSLGDLIAWFKRDPAAAQVLSSLPNFDQFATAFHQEARRLYPPLV